MEGLFSFKLLHQSHPMITTSHDVIIEYYERGLIICQRKISSLSWEFLYVNMNFLRW